MKQPTAISSSVYFNTQLQKKSSAEEKSYSHSEYCQDLQNLAQLQLPLAGGEGVKEAEAQKVPVQDLAEVWATAGPGN